MKVEVPPLFEKEKEPHHERNRSLTPTRSASSNRKRLIPVSLEERQARGPSASPSKKVYDGAREAELSAQVNHLKERIAELEARSDPTQTLRHEVRELRL